jgi:hypothetical protein
MENEIITLLAVLAALVFAYLTGRASGKLGTLKEVVELADLIRAAVKEAENFYTKSSAEKYDFVAGRAALWLSDKGYKIPAETVRQLIEGGVDIIHKLRDRVDPNTPDHK